MKEKPSIPGGLQSIIDAIVKLKSIRTSLTGTKNRKRNDNRKNKAKAGVKSKK